LTRTIVIANQKGGIGKSTSAINIGRALAEKGYRVLLVDLDPQGGLTAAIGVDSYGVRRSTYSLLMYDNVAIGRLVRTYNWQVGAIRLCVCEMVSREIARRLILLLLIRRLRWVS